MTGRERKVTTIPATLRDAPSAASKAARKRRVAAYARVSTDKDEQLSSYESQVDYYTRYIQGRDDWELAGVYTDEGITGTSTKRREGFKSMVAAALAGSIDLIVTKSVSRFARNTVDSLTTIRELKDAGVEVYFEKENIWTFDGKGELLITIMSSLAQEESRSISENSKWGKHKLLAEGRVWVPFSRLLGYKEGPDGGLAVDPDQAKVVRRIFSLFLGGKTLGEIARILNEDGVPTPCGGREWRWGNIDGILRNEKYKGDALLQKTFIPDFLTKKQVKNTGQVPQYYVRDNHEAIIDRATFDAVQAELERRKRAGAKRGGSGPFSNKVRCGVCGAWYGRKVWHSTSSNRRYVYQCNAKYRSKPPCPSTHVSQEQLEEAFASVMERVLSSKRKICASTRKAIETALDTSGLEEERGRLEGERERAQARVRECAVGSAPRETGQGERDLRHLTLAEELEAIEEGIAGVESEIKRREAAKAASLTFIEELEKAPGKMRGFDERLWHALVDHETVHPDGTISVVFKNGQEMRAGE